MFALGIFVLCFYAPWTQTQPGDSNTHATIGYAAVWSRTYAQVPGTHVDGLAFSVYSGAILFFAIIFGFVSYSFREQRGKEHGGKSGRHAHKPR
ncbi:MAG: hypothetical protein NVS9B4_09210 [Candidatus Acidiferrum sp.]